MAKAKAISDRYLQNLDFRSDEATANAGKIYQVPTSFTVRDKVGLEIHEVEINFPGPLSTVFTATGDGFIWGCGQIYNNGIVPTSQIASPGILHWEELSRLECGTAANAIIGSMKFRREFAIPRIVHPASLFVFHKGVSQPNELISYWRIAYRYVELAEADYQEILQTVILQGSL
jgi:hypothetical protein